MISVDARRSDLWPLSPIESLSLTTRSFFEYWGSLTYGYYDPLTLPTIISLAILNHVNL